MRGRTIGVLLGLWVGSAGAATAQGSAVLTHGSCATALSEAGVAAPCGDGSAVLFNPAALVGEPSVIGVGASAITTSGSFEYDGTGETVERPSKTSTVPFGFASLRVGDRFSAALGVFAPYGLSVAWPTSFEGRFVSHEAKLTNIYVQPTIAYQVDPILAVGGGVDVVFGSIELDRRLDLATTALPEAQQVFPGRTLTFGSFGIPLGTDFAATTLKGDGIGVGYNLGAILKVADDFSLGLRYFSEVEMDISGDADFTPVSTGLVLPAGNPFSVPAGTPVDALVAAAFTDGPLTPQGVSTTLTLPAQLVAGVAYWPARTIKLLADFQWTGWSSFARPVIDFDGPAEDMPLILDYQDTETYRFGGEWTPFRPLALRVGYIFNTAAEGDYSVSPLLPEAERNYYTAGIGYRLTDALAFDLAYQFVDQSTRRGRVRGRVPGMTGAQLRALNVGVYTNDANVINATVSYRFGDR